MKKYFFNIVWLSAERVVSIIGGLAVTIYVARYLGPEKMGMFNFSLAIISLIVPICQLGSDAIIFNRVAQNFKSGVQLLKSTLWLRLTIYLSLAVIVFCYCYLRGYDSEQLTILALMMVSCLFSSQDVYRIFFDATLKSKLNSISTQLGLCTSLVLRLFLVKFQVSVIWFSLPFITNTLIPFIIRKVNFSKKTKAINPVKKDIKRYNKYLIGAGIPLTISALSVVIYTRIAQVILGESLGVETVAFYNAATTLSQGWHFLPMAVITTLMSRIVKEKSQIPQGISFLYLICIIIALPIIGFFYYFSNEILLYTYGNAYQQTSEILPLMSITALFSVIGTVSSRGIVALGGYKYLMVKTLYMALANIALSTFLIEYYGLYGAVYSLLFTEIISCTFANYFFQKGVIFKAQMGILTSYGYFSKIH